MPNEPEPELSIDVDGKYVPISGYNELQIAIALNNNKASGLSLMAYRQTGKNCKCHACDLYK